ncbi:hypothetical protein VTJ49DRAFT_2060 [Mycothermus thermophilus]|uniref:Uncharacterized protein n=1 Tax=Humicola insolens TaxID=85995 RepID=A0ABR3VAR7_HUMIN
MEPWPEPPMPDTPANLREFKDVNEGRCRLAAIRAQRLAGRIRLGLPVFSPAEVSLFARSPSAAGASAHLMHSLLWRLAGSLSDLTNLSQRLGDALQNANAIAIKLAKQINTSIRRFEEKLEAAEDPLMAMVTAVAKRARTGEPLEGEVNESALMGWSNALGISIGRFETLTEVTRRPTAVEQEAHLDNPSSTRLVLMTPLMGMFAGPLLPLTRN